MPPRIAAGVGAQTQCCIDFQQNVSLSTTPTYPSPVRPSARPSVPITISRVNTYLLILDNNKKYKKKKPRNQDFFFFFSFSNNNLFIIQYTLYFFKKFAGSASHSIIYIFVGSPRPDFPLPNPTQIRINTMHGKYYIPNLTYVHGALSI